MVPITFVAKKELKKNTIRIDTLIVFGEGPVKPILISPELSAHQSEEWEKYKADPLHIREPNFWVIEQPHYVGQLKAIDQSEHLSDDDKDVWKEALRQEWQHLSQFALKRWGRQNALAAGLCLLNGQTDQIILSGGRTMPVWTKEILPEDRLKNWPSEATLMRDTIVRQYGTAYYAKYHRPIEKAIVVEDSSTNTLENFAYTINKHPELLHLTTRIGVLTAGHHLKRVKILAKIFSVNEDQTFQQSAQEVLQQKVELARPFTYEDYSSEVAYLKTQEERWIRGLTDPQYLTYWLGYIGLVQNPIVIQNAINHLNTPTWHEAAYHTFERLGLDFDEYTKQNIPELQKDNPTKYALLITAIQKLKDPTFRVMPPESE